MEPTTTDANGPCSCSTRSIERGSPREALTPKGACFRGDQLGKLLRPEELRTFNAANAARIGKRVAQQLRRGRAENGICGTPKNSHGRCELLQGRPNPCQRILLERQCELLIL